VKSEKAPMGRDWEQHPAKVKSTSHVSKLRTQFSGLMTHDYASTQDLINACIHGGLPSEASAKEEEIPHSKLEIPKSKFQITNSKLAVRRFGSCGW